MRRRARGIYFARAACPDARRWAAVPAEAFIPACLTPAVRSPLCLLPGARALPRGASAGPPSGCSFKAKPRAKRVACTRAEGPCRGQGLFKRCRNRFSMQPLPRSPETGGFPPWRKPVRFQKPAAGSPLCPLPGARALPRGASTGPPGGFSFQKKRPGCAPGRGSVLTGTSRISFSRPPHRGPHRPRSAGRAWRPFGPFRQSARGRCPPRAAWRAGAAPPQRSAA